MNRREGRLKRARKFRARNAVLDTPRLVVNRTLMHTYAQVIKKDNSGSVVVASVSSVDKGLKGKLKGSKIEQAAAIGKEIAERAKKAGVTKLAFDRSGFKYHGRVKALADAAREVGLEF